MTRAEAREAYELALASPDGGNPRVHPNGFIQLDLGLSVEPGQGHSGATRRLHVWNPPGLELPTQAQRSPIHDHVFDMQSRVIVGMLQQVVYEVSLSPIVADDSPPLWTHEVWLANYSQASKSTLDSTGVFVSAFVDTRTFVTGGQLYRQPACTFHDTRVTEPCLTIMEKTQVYGGRPARVLVELGQEPDNEFERASALDSIRIYAAIERTLNL